MLLPKIQRIIREIHTSDNTHRWLITATPKFLTPSRLSTHRTTGEHGEVFWLGTRSAIIDNELHCAALECCSTQLVCLLSYQLPHLLPSPLHFCNVKVGREGFSLGPSLYHRVLSDFCAGHPLGIWSSGSTSKRRTVLCGG